MRFSFIISKLSLTIRSASLCAMMACIGLSTGALLTDLSAEAGFVGCYNKCGNSCAKNANGGCPADCPYGHWTDAPGCSKTSASLDTLVTMLDSISTPVALPTTFSGISLDSEWKQNLYQYSLKNLLHPSWGLTHSERDYLKSLELAKSDGEITASRRYDLRPYLLWPSSKNA